MSVSSSKKRKLLTNDEPLNKRQKINNNIDSFLGDESSENSDDDNFLGLDDNAEDIEIEKGKIKQMEEDKSLQYQEQARNNALQKQEFKFVFPSYKRLLKEKNETPNLSLLKDRIDNVLEVLSNFKVLRDESHSRKEYLSLLGHSLAKYYGYNLDLINMFLTLFNPNECLAFLEANEKSRPLTIRCNTLKCRRRDLAKLLIDRGINLDPLSSWSKEGLKINNTNNKPIGATPEYLSGYYMIQSAASLLPILAIGNKCKGKILDMCAAPGGKTTFIAQQLLNDDQSIIIANDINKDRLKAVYGNIHRMSLAKNCIVTNIDGRKLKQNFGENVFDYILLDAPCSCLGVISRDLSIKYSKTFNDVIKQSQLQKELILEAIDLCKVGGYIVYSTCSITVYENEGVIDHALNKRFVKVMDTGLKFGEDGFTRFKDMRFDKSLSKTKRYYPHIHNLDGFYVAKLYKCDKGIKGIKKAHTL